MTTLKRVIHLEMRLINRNTTQSKEFYCAPYKATPSKKLKHYLILDVHVQQLDSEVGGSKHLDKLKISIASAYDSKKDKLITFNAKDIEKLFDLCYKRLVVGFGIKRKALLILASHGLDINKCRFFDMMVSLESMMWGPFLKLEAVSNGTVGKYNQFSPIDLFKEKKMDELKTNAEETIQILKEIFEYGYKNGVIKVSEGEETIEVPVQWSSLLLKE
eukprot:NODE_411_length_7931_cov_0.531920.p4 type:complete len:217 gc:universal NODE_411_length_7931_cov_0.531920:1912-1262(-)